MPRPEVSLHLPLVSTGEVGPDGYEYPWIGKIVEWLQEHPAENEAFEFDDSESEPTADDPAGDSWEEVFLLYNVADEAVAVAIAKSAAQLPGVPRGGYVVVNYDPEATDTRIGRHIEIEER